MAGVPLPSPAFAATRHRRGCPSTALSDGGRRGRGGGGTHLIVSCEKLVTSRVQWRHRPIPHPHLAPGLIGSMALSNIQLSCITLQGRRQPRATMPRTHTAYPLTLPDPSLTFQDVHPPPSFHLDWTAQAVVLEAGTPGVDANSVTTALIGLSDAQGGEDAELLETDTRPLVFATLTYDELTKAAGAAEEGTALHEAQMAITTAQETHAASEDPDKGDFTIPLHLIANLFKAHAQHDRQTYKETLTNTRTEAFEQAKITFEEANTLVDEKSNALKEIKETYTAQSREHQVLLDQWDEEDEEDDGPGPGPDYDLVVDAESALNSAKDARTVARREMVEKQKQRSAPAEVAKSYVIAEDFFVGVDGVENTPENSVGRLASLAQAGLPARAVVNLARRRVAVKTDDEIAGASETKETDGEPKEGEEPPAEQVVEEDDEYPPLVNALMDAYKLCLSEGADFDAPARLLASVPLDFPREETIPDASVLAKLLADKLGVLALAQDEYASWKETAQVVRVPDDFSKIVQEAVNAQAAGNEAEEGEARDEAGDATGYDDAKKPTPPPPPKTQMDMIEHRTYDQLLAGVPHERLSCAVVLDAIIGQVCAGECDPVLVEKASDAAAAEAAMLAVTAALVQTKLDYIPDVSELNSRSTRFGFGSTTGGMGGTMPSVYGTKTATFGGTNTFKPGVNTSTFKRGTDPLFPDETDLGFEDRDELLDREQHSVTLLPFGDAAAALRSNYEPGTVAATLAAKPGVASVVTLDPDLVEQKMASLAFAPGCGRIGMPSMPVLDEDQRSARKTSLSSFLAKPDSAFNSSSGKKKSVSFSSNNASAPVSSNLKVSLAAAERWELMNTVVDEMLPPGVLEDHGDEVRSRRHWEPLTRAAYANVVQSAQTHSGTLDVSSKYFEPEDALLVTCLPAKHETDMTDYSVNTAVPWCEFVGLFIQGFNQVLEERIEREEKKKKLEKKQRDEEERQLETEQSELLGMPDDEREAKEQEMEHDQRELEELRRQQEDEEQAAWAWDGSVASDDEDEGVTRDGDKKEPNETPTADEDGRRWVLQDAKGVMTRLRSKVVPMPSVSYCVEGNVGKCFGISQRLYPAVSDSAVVLSPDGGVDVVVAGVRLGIRSDTNADGSKSTRIVASLVDQPGTCIVVGRAPEDPPPPHVEVHENEEDAAAEAEDPTEGEESEAPLPESPTEEEPPPPPKPVYVQYTSESGLCVSVTSDRVVVQSRVDAGAVAAGSDDVPSSLKTLTKKSELIRAILSDGSTISHAADGVSILCPNGNVGTRGVDSKSWMGTNAQGIRWEQSDSFVYVPPPPPAEGEEGETAEMAVETAEGDERAVEPETDPVPKLKAGDIITPTATFVSPVSSATVVDPETRAVVTSREDLTLVVEHPAGVSGEESETKESDLKEDPLKKPPKRSLVVHADGTRVCKDLQTNCLWLVEKDGFASTHADCETKRIDVDLGAALASIDENGVCSLSLGSYGALCADKNGCVVFVPGHTTSDPMASAQRALTAANTPEGELRCATSVIGAGSPDVDGAFIFDLQRAAVRYVDEAARRKEIGFVPYRDKPEYSYFHRTRGERGELSPDHSRVSVNSAASSLGPSVSQANVAGENISGDDIATPATPAQFVARAGELRGACAFGDLDPPPELEPQEETDEDEANAEDGDKTETTADEPGSEKPPSEVPPSPTSQRLSTTIDPEPSTLTTTSTVSVEPSSIAPELVVPINAPFVSPRVFVCYPDQDEYFEVVSVESFQRYRMGRQSDRECTSTTAPVIGTESGSGAVNHTFLTPLRKVPEPPTPLVVPTSRARDPADPIKGRVRAVPSLQTPSIPKFPTPPSSLVMPRIAAVDAMGTNLGQNETVGNTRGGTAWGVGTCNQSNTMSQTTTKENPTSPKSFVFREIVEYPELSVETLRALDKALNDHANATEEDLQVKPESYLLRDVRSDAFLVAEQNLADRVIAARKTAQSAYFEKRKVELAVETDEARRAAEVALDLGVLTLAREMKVAPVGKTPPARKQPTFPPCSFFEVEEGRDALSAMEKGGGQMDASNGFESLEGKGRATLYPRRTASAVAPPLPNPVKLASIEPPMVRAFEANERFEDEYFENTNGMELWETNYSYENELEHEHELRGIDTTAPRPELSSDFSGDRTFRTTTRMDFEGNRRSRTLAPSQYYKEKAPFVRNVAHEDTEGNSRRRLRTASTTLLETRRIEKIRSWDDRKQHPAPDAQFELSPAHVHFGRVLPDVAVKRRVTLTNVSVDLGRFTVRQPFVTGPFSVEHQPGMVSPGLAATLKVKCHATRPGEYVGEAAILTERQVFVLSLSAMVVGRGEEENVP